MVLYALYKLHSSYYKTYKLIGVYNSNPLNLIYEYEEPNYGNRYYDNGIYDTCIREYDVFIESTCNNEDIESGDKKLVIAEIKILSDQYKIQKLNIDIQQF